MHAPDTVYCDRMHMTVCGYAVVCEMRGPCLDRAHSQAIPTYVTLHVGVRLYNTCNYYRIAFQMPIHNQGWAHVECQCPFCIRIFHRGKGESGVIHFKTCTAAQSFSLHDNYHPTLLSILYMHNAGCGPA